MRALIVLALVLLAAGMFMLAAPLSLIGPAGIIAAGAFVWLFTARLEFASRVNTEQ